MNSPSTRIRKRRARQRQLPDPRQTLSILLRRSYRIQSKRSSVSTPHVLGSFYERQSTVEQRPANPQTSQRVRATSYSRAPPSGPIEVSAPVPSKAQFQEFLCPPQPHNHQTRKRRPDRPIKTSAERPLKRARLTEKNLKVFEKMGRRRKFAGTNSTRQPLSTITTSDKDFGPQLRRNNVVFTHTDARAPDDVHKVREFLNRRRESEPPDRLDYHEYLISTEGFNNELTMQTTGYQLLSKRTSREARISGYGQRVNYAWSEVDNDLTTGLSDAKPDIFESYRKTDYPPEAVDALSGALAPTSYDIGMPAFAVEVKGCEGSMQVAHLQCAYGGALMTEGARAMHIHMDKSDDDFYGRTQALTVGYNGETVKFYGHHAVQIPASSQPASDGVDSSIDSNIYALEYHQYLLSCDTPRDSFENFQTAYKHMRNAQDIGYQWATERKDALWAYTNADNTQTSPDVPAPSRQSSNDFVIPISSAMPDSCNYDAYDDGMVQTGQLREYWTISAANNQDSSVQIPTADNGYASPGALTYTAITPPQSSRDISLPLKSQQLSVPTVIEPSENADSNARGHKRTLQEWTSAIDTIGGPGEVDYKSPSRKTCRKH